MISEKENSLILDNVGVKKCQWENRSRSAISYPTLAKRAGRKLSRKEENEPIHTTEQMSHLFKFHLQKYGPITTL